MKKEYLIVVFISIFTILLNNLPLIYGYTVKKDHLEFLGRRVNNSQDQYTYLAFIEQSKQGLKLFENLYTPEDQKATMLRPSYLVIGRFAHFLNLSSITAYHLSRIILTMLFFIVLYIFISKYFKEIGQRILTFSLITLSFGLGFILQGLVPNSSDLNIPESITFLALAEAPHFILAQILMVLGFYFYLEGMEKKSIFWYLLSATSFLLLSFEHPFNLIVISLVVLITTIYQATKNIKDRFSHLSGMLVNLVAIGAGLSYQYIETIASPILNAWSKQNILLSPEPINYLLGYGLILILSIFGIEKFLKNVDFSKILILAWVLITFVLLYAPFDFQRRLSEGLHIPLVILATWGLIEIYDFLKHQMKELAFVVVASLIFIMVLPAFIWVYQDTTAILKNDSSNYYYYLMDSELLGLSWLKQNSKPEGIILSNWFYGNLIPGITGRKVYVGHKIQTIQFNQKIDKLNEFLLNLDHPQALRFLKDYQIKYIFLGINDSMVNFGFKPFEKPYLKNVYNKEGVLIFEVI